MRKLIAGLVAGLMLGTVGTATAGSINAWRHYSGGDFWHEAGNYKVGQVTLKSGKLVYLARTDYKGRQREFLSCRANRG